MASIVGSSWNSAESSGLAPMRVAGRNGQGVRVLLAERAQLVGQEAGAARRDRRLTWRGRDEAATAGGRIEVAVEVVDAEELDGDVLVLGRRLGSRYCDGQHGERQPEDARSTAQMRRVHSVLPGRSRPDAPRRP